MCVCVFVCVCVRVHVYACVTHVISVCRISHVSTVLYRSKIHTLLIISDFRREVDEICALLGYYAAYSGNSLPTFRYNRSRIQEESFFFFFLDSWPVTIGCPETSVRTCHYSLRNIPEGRGSLQRLNFKHRSYLRQLTNERRHKIGADWRWSGCSERLQFMANIGASEYFLRHEK